MDSKKRTIYLSGPMTGLPDFNRQAFNDATYELRKAGHVVHNPAEYEKNYGEFKVREAFAIYTNFICTQADTIVLLPGWRNSGGAKVEVALAEYVGLELLEWPDMGKLTLTSVTVL